MDIRFIVYKKEGNVPRRVGVVLASNKVRADTKAKMLFGHGSWTVQAETADEAA